MRVVACVLSLTACGRLDFAATPDADVRYADQVLADRPLAYYRLDEAPGSSAALDTSGHGAEALYYAEVGRSGMGRIELGMDAPRLRPRGCDAHHLPGR